jgi:uncharacterized protein
VPSRSPLRPRHVAVVLGAAALVLAGCRAEVAEREDTEVAGQEAAEDAADLRDDGATDVAAAVPPRAEVPPLHPAIDGWDATVVTLRGDDVTARVDARVATSPEQLRRGLMRVPALPAGTGMLFVFDGERTGAFWMKDTLVALDIAFATGDGTIAAILTMTPCIEDPCPTYDPAVAYAAALEVPAGWFASAGIDVGDELTWSDPQPPDSP